jgi:hypothetical protein
VKSSGLRKQGLRIPIHKLSPDFQIANYPFTNDSLHDCFVVQQIILGAPQ